MLTFEIFCFVTVALKEAVRGNDFVNVYSGPNHSMGITAAGQVYTWGANTMYQLGYPGAEQASCMGVCVVVSVCMHMYGVCVYVHISCVCLCTCISLGSWRCAGEVHACVCVCVCVCVCGYVCILHMLYIRISLR